jgi:hypothetical protein
VAVPLTSSIKTPACTTEDAKPEQSRPAANTKLRNRFIFISSYIGLETGSRKPSPHLAHVPAIILWETELSLILLLLLRIVHNTGQMVWVLSAFPWPNPKIDLGQKYRF